MVVASALAQTSPDVSGQLFRPSIDSQKTWWTDDSHRARSGFVLVRGVLHYANQPVVYRSSDDAVTKVVSDVLQLSLLGGVTAGPIRFGVDVPVYLLARGVEGDEFGLGDVSLDVKATLLDPETKPFGLALAGRLSAPTTTVAASLGNRGLGWEVSVIADKSFGDLLIAANVGTRGIPGQDLENFRWDDQFQARLGLGYGKVETSGVSLDVGSHINYANVGAGSLPAEAIVGGWTRAAKVLRLRAGVGTGLTNGFGAPRLRLIAGISYEPHRVKDTDRDGIVDSQDACVDVPEDVDRFEDDDGCPEKTLVRVEVVNPAGEPLDAAWIFAGRTSNSGLELDGGDYPLSASAKGYIAGENVVSVPDGAPFTARITLQPEPVGLPTMLTVVVQDEDGRVVPGAYWQVGDDSTRRTVGEPLAVVASRQSVRAEAPGYRAERVEVQVEEAKTTSIVVVLKRAKVEIAGERIDIKESVYFETGKAVIKAASHGLLDEVAQVLREHPELAVVRIEGHTDSRGSESSNLDLSTRRAASVRTYLIDKGVAATRLRSEGFGETRPLERAENPVAWEKNRRVDFFVAERTD